ncbi:hypothetical protein SELMODRAFT_98841 [Selaginella moellendorffii]|uniref:Peptidase A1 domain-containing protein n=2 Tax=Selaginella moellendorffii TaxID=88036 RepID=D8RPV5_SELML|nr:hypothetical protein SELMODRAFT_98841 [Selaginella moellendorffii]
MDLSLGTPPQPLNFTLAVDSGFSWVACSSSCAINCTTASLFQPGLSTSHTKLPCGSPSCSAFSAVSTSCGPSSSCSYNTSYGTNFSSAGDLVSDIATMDSVRNRKVAANLSLGCGRDSGGLLELLDTSGFVGFDKGNVSFMGQLSALGYRSKFIYCLPSDTFRGKLVIGNYKLRNASISSSMAYTPMITNPQAAELYFINLSTISIDKNKFQVPIQGFLSNGTGGTVIDTTTFLSYLTSDFYTQLVQAIKNYTTNLVEVSSSVADALGVELCYNISANSDFPPPATLTYHFLGGAGVEVSTWFLLDDSDSVNNTICMAIGRSESVGPNLNVIGTYQQLDLTVEYDLEQMRYGFGAQGCNTTMVVDVNTSSAEFSKKPLWLMLLLVLLTV